MEERAVRAGDRSRAALAVENERLQRALRARLEEEAGAAPGRDARRATACARGGAHAGHRGGRASPGRRCGDDRALRRSRPCDGRRRAGAHRASLAFPVGRQIELGPEIGARARARDARAGARRLLRRHAGAVPGGAARARHAGDASPRRSSSTASCGARVAAGSRRTPSPPTRRLASARSPSSSRRRSPTSTRGSSSRNRAPASSKPPMTLAAESSAICTTAPSSASSALALSLRLAAASAEPATATAIEGCIEELLTALAELRDLARGLHPAVLTEHGLLPALEMLAARSSVPVGVDADLDGRLPPAHETALYFVAAEALTNVAKYARASAAEVTLRRRRPLGRDRRRRRRRRRSASRTRQRAARSRRSRRGPRRSPDPCQRPGQGNHRPCPRPDRH